MSNEAQQQALRDLPAVHRLLDHPVLAPLADRVPREWVSRTAADVLALRRREILEGDGMAVGEDELADRVKNRLHLLTEPSLKPLLNGTGIVLHTNLGRAVLSRAAARAVERIARSASNLEYRLAEGERGSRHDHVEALLCRLTGAEAAMVVNNNAAAVFLVLRSLARGKEVPVSRGQLVEIGGSFRVSDIMRESGARLVEVGTTNKTRLADFEAVITDESGLILKVHTSNFKIVGFTEEPSREQLAQLAADRGLPLYEDLGSGVLYDLRTHGIGEEPTIQECVKAGTDLLSFSGDKLLGGPQVGIIVGGKRWIARLKKNQLARSLRVDKFTLAGLEATLRHYLDPEEAAREIPTLRQILKTPGEMAESASRLKELLEKAAGGRVRCEVVPSRSEVGGGSMPGVELDTLCVAVTPVQGSTSSLERRLREVPVPVIGRVSRDRLLLDLRTLEEEDFAQAADSFRLALGN